MRYRVIPADKLTWRVQYRERFWWGFYLWETVGHYEPGFDCSLYFEPRSFASMKEATDFISQDMERRRKQREHKLEPVRYFDDFEELGAE